MGQLFQSGFPLESSAFRGEIFLIYQRNRKARAGIFRTFPTIMYGGTAERICRIAAVDRSVRTAQHVCVILGRFHLTSSWQCPENDEVVLWRRLRFPRDRFYGHPFDMRVQPTHRSVQKPARSLLSVHGDRFPAEVPAERH